MFAWLGQLSRSIVTPIAILPAAAILLRIGEFQSTNPALSFTLHLFHAAGDSLFAYLPLWFAIGVAIGLTQGEGIAGFAAAIGYAVMTGVMQSFNPGLDAGVLGGVISGITSAVLYRRFYQIEFPPALGFFGGKRFVPLLTALVMVVLGAVLGLIWQPLGIGLDALSVWAYQIGPLGVFVYGVVNRLLLPTGLHHLLNSVAWFQVGSFVHPSTGSVVHGDMAGFFAGDPAAGSFMTGFYPITMFGLPAVCLAVIQTAPPERRKAVGTLMMSAALASFLTGITEPIEFMFMFLAPALYVVHALLTGLSLAVCNYLQIKLGFGFSAGLIDYVVNYPSGSHPLRLIPVGLAIGCVYYLIFRSWIIWGKLETPGRERERTNASEQNTFDDQEQLHLGAGAEGWVSSSYTQRADAIVHALGGFANIILVEACMTRLRLELHDSAEVQEDGLRGAGAWGVIILGPHQVQAVFGTESERLKDEILKLPPTKEIVLYAPLSGHIRSLTDVPDEVFASKLLGDGIAIEPASGLVLSPCNGVVTATFPAGHAIGITSEDGLHILIHVGINTISLGGAGFTTLVHQEQKVTRGMPILLVDLPAVSEQYSVVTPVIITAPDSVIQLEQVHQPGTYIEAKQPLLRLLIKR
ncbi:MAG: system D-glucose-specific component, Glc family / system D-glucose-specific [Bacilli bacterium]|nr:system D-glucose-specific component, Glc family / system D-glucose-specific [Bacilli bacterium]